MVPLLIFIPDRSKAKLYEVIMTSLQGEIKWSHVFSDKILKYYASVKEIVL